ncbi:MAG: HD domain-containing protein [Burkholderiales bacterium]|nr:HD domain-containing protein [Burkholderiales bacterium]
MQSRRNDFDVTNRIQTTDVVAVHRETARLFRMLYPGVAHVAMDRAFTDVARIYAGQYPGYQACDTGYHNLQHVMDVTLAMTRLMDGYERSRNGTSALGVRLFQLGVIVGLFHDIGYLRKTTDTTAKNGAEYTLSHVSRGAEFLREYMPEIGLADCTEEAAELIHFTGFEKRIADILVQDPVLRMLGSLLGSADIIAQMSDRCYLEKCRDRLYLEFVAGGIAVKKTTHGDEVVFESGDDLVNKTPAFFESAVNRLEYDLGGAYNYAATHFGGFNLYMHAAAKNVHFAKELSVKGIHLLRRAPPEQAQAGSA